VAAELRADGEWYAGWLEAAVLGTALGLESAGAAGRCIVTEVRDREVPSATSPRAIAIAAVRAAWAAVGFAPDEETAQRIEAQAADQAGSYW
jgi:hypothetical protein